MTDFLSNSPEINISDNKQEIAYELFIKLRNEQKSNITLSPCTHTYILV